MISAQEMIKKKSDLLWVNSRIEKITKLQHDMEDCKKELEQIRYDLANEIIDGMPQGKSDG